MLYLYIYFESYLVVVVSPQSPVQPQTVCVLYPQSHGQDTDHVGSSRVEFVCKKDHP